MKNSITCRVKGFLAPKIALKSLLVSLGLAAGAFAQYPGKPDSADSWREWMSVKQREPSQTSGPRLYLMTDREILQTSPDKASFQSGSYRMILADGSVPDVDGDADGYTDGLESGKSDRNDPESIPRDDKGVPLPTDAFGILVADGSILGIANSTLATTTMATLVRSGSGSSVRVIGAPASAFQRPVGFRDFSSQFYYFSDGGQTTGEFREYPLSLYQLKKEYLNPQDGNALEKSMVPGVYSVEFPTIVNPPYGKAVAQVAHRVVPNGTLTIGSLKRPTWLVRSLKSFEEANTAPVEQQWVDGKLKFDPYLPLSLTWDNLVSGGLATQADYIEVSFEDDASGQISYTFRVNASRSTLSTDLSNAMYGIYGTIRETLEDKTFPLKLNGHIVMQYFRYANGLSSADLSSVTTRVPIEMYTSYASWRQELFALGSENDDSISGPSADPDGDGLTNQQEFDQGTDPLVARLAVVDATSADITINSATLGATIELDPLTENNPLAVPAPEIIERGVVYSVSTTNPFPTIDGPGVNRLVSSPVGVGTYTVSATGLVSNTPYAFRGYVITDAGIFYSTPVSNFTTLEQPPVTLPTVTTPTSSSITHNSAVLGGNVSSDGNSPITERGVVYSVTSTNDNPFIAGAGVTQKVGTGTTGVFTVSVTPLLANTTYSFRAYAINAVGTSYTSSIGTFTTSLAPTVPILTSQTSANLTSTSATLGGNVTATGGSAVLQRGIVFSLTATNPDPIMGGTGVSAFAVSTTGTGVFTANATNLSPGQSYSYKAYAINAVGTGYTSVGTFTTLGMLATISAPTISNVTSTSATLGANVTSDGSSTILERGFVYSATAADSDPNVGDAGVIKLTAAGTTGVFSVNITGLSANTGYTFKPFARNAIGTAYGAPYAFFTTFPPLTVTSPTVSAVTATTAILGGTVASDGATTVSERGVVYSLDPSVAPVIGGPGVIRETATGTMGAFTVSVTGLSSATSYYFRAYATNTVGTSYSVVSTFKTETAALLGLALMEWVPAPQQPQVQALQLRTFSLEEPQPAQLQTSSVEEPQPTAVVESPQVVPGFVYYKAAAEEIDGMTYQIETSSDNREWLPINENDWTVTETSAEIRATWVSTGSPPTRIFFRIRSDIP